MPNNTGFSSIEKSLVRKIHSSLGNPPFEIVLGKSEAASVSRFARPIQVVVPDRRSLVKLALDPEMAFGDGYSDGSIEVRGNMVEFLETVLGSMQTVEKESWFVRLTSWWLERLHQNTLRGSRENIHRHYDLNNDFYKLWLDSRMLYTCAYFPAESAPLEEAQLAKMDHVCRKLQLQRGERVVEAGCGWGALALHMARHYGVTVRAFNISHEQIAFARERARREGLDRQVEFIEDDYRNISGEWDAFMSVGMLEHVGKDHYKEFGRIIQRAIGKTGRGLVHFIGRNFPHRFSPWIRKRIFPGAYAPALSEVRDLFEPSNLSVLDVENIRMHYAKTLEHWLARFEANANRIEHMFSAEFVRAWRLYLAGSLASFRVGALQLFQILFAGAQCQRIPWTRAHLYEEPLPVQKERKWMTAVP
jgi:cyclopropane-fatty-acyl-phospholipid synthase